MSQNQTKKPKPFRRHTGPIELQPDLDPKDAIVGIIDGKVSLVDPRSGQLNEDHINGHIDPEKLEGLTETEKEEYRRNFEDELDRDLFGETLQAYTIDTIE